MLIEENAYLEVVDAAAAAAVVEEVIEFMEQESIKLQHKIW